ncbi:MAG: fatty acid desaturase [Spirulinaceae cyanobacterium SM2_1_0]|nr:fatty acid desaturase [Spirulinaceae cyanobacterium SM2_1_0]
MYSVEQQKTTPRFISQTEYAKALRPLLPAAAFAPDPSKLLILLINLGIVGLGWAIAAHLDRWPAYWLWLYLPLTIIMANSVVALLFTSHDLMHGSVWRSRRWNYPISFLGLTLLWMPPTLWKVIHNRVHHSTTNSLDDPDRNYLSSQPATWGKWIQDAFVPSNTVSKLGLLLGMLSAWGVHGFRNLTSVIFFNHKHANYVPAPFVVSRRDQRWILGEVLVMLGLHLGILSYLQFDPIKLILAYFLPIGLGYAGVMAYIYTNHMLSPLTEVNDPLLNSVSLHVPPLLDLLHCNFSYHAEHHIFPSLNSNYYPQVRALLAEHYPERMGYTLGARAAWRFLLTTPRHYQDATTFTDASGQLTAACQMNPVMESLECSASKT